jgi:uroporphyrinogen-III synthase
MCDFFYFESHILKNKTIAILENRTGEQMADLVRKYGGNPFSAPALAEVPDIDPALIKSMLEDCSASVPDLFIFQTGVGTKALFAATDTLNLTESLLKILATTKVLVRGPKPTAVLRARGVRIDLTAGDPYTTAEILAHLEGMTLTGKRVVVQRFGDTNVELENALKARGAIVSEVATYRWSLPENIQPLIDLMDALDKKTVDMVCFTSASQVYNFFKVAELSNRTQTLKDSLNQTLIASIGPVCTAALKKYDLRIDIEPSPPKLGPFITAINQHFS